MLLSDMLKGGQTLQGKAGSLATNANDLLLLDARGQLYTANVSDYAAAPNIGAAIVAATTLNGTLTPGGATGKYMSVYSDGSIFIATAASTSNYGCTLYKYNAAGALVGSIVLDSTATVMYTPIILQLSNGNICVIWALNGGALKFAILNSTLGIVMSATTIGTPSSNQYDAVALSGGGFAISSQGASGAYLTIYSNAGASVLATTLISGTPATGTTTSMLQLSNGNIAIAIGSTVASKALGYAIYSASGSVVVAYAVLNSTATGSTSTYPKISAVAGFFCCEIQLSGTSTAYVLSNAGALQGGPCTTAAYATAALDVLTNDGANFWLVTTSASNMILTVAIPTSGTGFVTTTTTASDTSLQFGVFIERGLMVIVGSSGTGSIVLSINAGLNTTPLASSAAPTNVSSSLGAVQAIPAGDFSFVWCTVNSGSGTIFGVWKYLNASIVGVSQQTVAAGNTGALISYSHGGGTGKNGYATNPVIGTLGKSFNHSAANIVGNQGTILGNAVALEGIV